MNKIFSVFFLSWWIASASAEPVISVADGDTLTVLSRGRPLQIRLGNIDSPEREQAFGAASKKSLSDLCYRKDATYSIQSVDRYGRVVALVKCDGVDVHRRQVERGLAWVYARYNNDSSLLPLQNEARIAQRGLWIDRGAVEPWMFRRSSVP